MVEKRALPFDSNSRLHDQHHQIVSSTGIIKIASEKITQPVRQEVRA
jgi:hypothetical protein